MRMDVEAEAFELHKVVAVLILKASSERGHEFLVSTLTSPVEVTVTCGTCGLAGTARIADPFGTTYGGPLIQEDCSEPVTHEAPVMVCAATLCGREADDIIGNTPFCAEHARYKRSDEQL